jgi:hypothetical protein
MRREPYSIGSIVHIVKRGARGISFLRDEEDRYRLLLQLAHFNDEHVSPYWFRDLLAEDKQHGFERPSSWPERQPLVKLHAFCLQSNHLHLCAEEIREGGISTFMQKIGTGISAFLNEKYGESGSPFQGSYRSKTVDDDAYLRYLIAYIEIKNTFEQLPGGYAHASQYFDHAYEQAIRFNSSSLPDHLRILGKSDFPKRGIIADDLIPTLWSADEFRRFAADMITGRAHLTELHKDAVSGAFE